MDMDSELDLEDGVTYNKGQLKRAFAKMSNAKIVNRPLLNNFYKDGCLMTSDLQKMKNNKFSPDIKCNKNKTYMGIDKQKYYFTSKTMKTERFI